MNRKHIVLFIIVIGVFILFKSGGKGIGKFKLSTDENMISGFEQVKPWGISPEKGFSLKPSKKYVTEGNYSLEVVYPKGGLPSINTKKLKHDWGNYEYFSFDVYNPHKEPLDFVVRLDDSYRKRVNIGRTLQPGPNPIKIHRSQIASQIDPSNISFIVLFLQEPRRRYTLYFDNMRLTKSDLLPEAESGLEMLSKAPENQSLKEYTGDPLPVRKAVEVPRPEVPKQGALKIPIAKLKKAEGDLLISGGVPFAPGQLESEKSVAFFDRDGKELPIAVKVLARWPQDQSIRSLLVQFKHPIENLFEYVTMKWGAIRRTRDLTVVEPTWSFPEGFILMPAEWLCASEVIGEQVPVTQKLFVKYDENIEKHFVEIRDKPKTGNLRNDGYYSTPHVFYQFYVRSGDSKYFIAARKELLYYRENQIILEGSDRGKSTVDSKPRYVYLQALADDYLLTGDPRSLEVAGYMAEYLKNNFNPKRAFHPKSGKNFWTERYQAFPFLGVLTYYEISGDKAYKKIADEYMDQLYKTQLEWPSRGGFIHNLYAHDPEEGARPDEYGGSPFMTGLVLEPIIKYHRLTGSEKAADSIFRAVDWLIKEGLVSRGDSFKYTTADKYSNSEGEPDLNLLIVHALGYAYRLSGYEEEEYLNVGRKVFERGIREAYLTKRKHFNQNFRSSGHFLAYIKDAPIRVKKDAAVEAGKPLAVRELKNVFLFENFEYSHGKFKSLGDSLIRIDKTTVYLNGNSLNVRSNFLSSNLSAGMDIDEWNIVNYPHLRFAYLIPKGTPVAVRVQTEFGDWICVGGTPQSQCGQTAAKNPFLLIDDGEWHETDINIKEVVQSVLPGVKRLSAFTFYTDGNAGKDDQFWIDDFKIVH